MRIDGQQAILPSLRRVLAAWAPVALAAVVVLVLLVAIPMVPRSPDDPAPAVPRADRVGADFRSQPRFLR